MPHGDAVTSVIGADPLTSAPNDLTGGTDPTAGVGSLDPVVDATGTAGQQALVGTEPILQPVTFELPPKVLDIPPSLDGSGVGLPSPTEITPAIDPAVGLPDELGGMTGSLADTAGGLPQAVAHVADPLVQTVSDTVGPGAGLPDPVLQPLFGGPGGVTGATDAVVNPLVGGTDTALQPALGAGEPQGIGESARSIVDAVANGISTTASVYGRVAALVLLLGLMAARLSASITAVASYAAAGAGVSLRTGWLTSWGSARCLVVNASRVMSVNASGSQRVFSYARGSGGAIGQKGRGVLGALARQLPGHLGRRPILGGLKSGGLGQFLRALLMIAGGLLALALLPARMLGRRGLVLFSPPLRLSLAVVSVSTLIAVGIVLLMAP